MYALTTRPAYCDGGAGDPTDACCQAHDDCYESNEKFAAWYIDTTEKVANQAIDFQESATQWAKETPLAPIFEAQYEYGKKIIERSANAARSVLRLE